MINLDWSVDYTCKTKSTDVSYNEFKMMVDCISQNDINNYLEVKYKNFRNKKLYRF